VRFFLYYALLYMAVLVGGVAGGLAILVVGAAAGAVASTICYGCGMAGMFTTDVLLIAAVLWAMVTIASKR
jgi:hypothetical protein